MNTRNDYLRNRPFFVIKVINRPARGVRTEVKGWGDITENWAVFEDTSVVDRVSRKLVQEASIIIDIMNKTCVVNNVYPDTSKDTVVQYYTNKYQSQIDEALDIWKTRRAAA